jgi:hypothetical protein
MVAKLKQGALAVRDDNLSAFQVSDTLNSLVIYRDAIRNLMDEAEQLERQQAVAALESERIAMAGEVEDLISQQDRELTDLFKEAARAAKFNKTLSYIRMAAKIYQGWTKMEAYLTKGEKAATIRTAEATRDGLIQAQRREPANAALLGHGLKLVNNLLGLADQYGDLPQARRAQERFDEVYTRTVNAIPVGAEQSFDVYVSNSNPFLFKFLTPSGQPVIMNSDSTFLKTVTLKGVGRSLDVHMEVIAD